MNESPDSCFPCGASLEEAEQFAIVHSKDGSAELRLCMNCFERWRIIGIVDYVTLTGAVNRALASREQI